MPVFTVTELVAVVASGCKNTVDVPVKKQIVASILVALVESNVAATEAVSEEEELVALL